MSRPDPAGAPATRVPLDRFPPGGRLVVHPARTARPRATLALGHGAGGASGRDLDALAASLPDAGVTVIRHVQPWVLAGRRVAVRPAALDEAWSVAAATVRALAGETPLLVGGRSAGARVACRVAAATGAAGVVALAFPLHPPGRPDRTRAPELAGSGAPTLVVQGSRDAFGSADDVRAAVEAAGAMHVRVVEIPTATHEFATRKRDGLPEAEVAERIVAAVATFVRDVAGEAPVHQTAGSPSGTRITSTPTSSVEVVFSP